MKFSRFSIYLTLALAFLFASCAKQELPAGADKDYGYVQFKLYKDASYEQTKAVVAQLEYLNDASKISVMLQYGDDQIMT